MKNELRAIQTFFSHHMRNCTAMIAASVTLLSYRMTGDEQKLLDEVTEASFLLDLFDAGMNICYDHVFGADTINFNDDFDTVAFVNHFLDQCKTIMSERDIALDFHVTNPSVINGNSHELRVIINLIIYEIMIQASRSLVINLDKNLLTLSIDAYFSAPEVWATLKDVCKKRGIAFSYDNRGCILEFGV